jgi:hypothetical protein
MAWKIHHTQIGERREIAANGTFTFRWNNPPSGLVSYFALAAPAPAVGPHGTSSCEVGITSVRHTYTKDNYNSDSEHVEIDVKNYGDAKAGFTMWQTWLTQS